MRDLEAYKAKQLAAGLKPKSLNNHLIMLRKALSVAVDWELLSHVPKVRWLKGPQPEFDFLTFEEAERFLDAADPEWRPIFTLALRTGLRIGELRALRKGNWWRRRESKLPTLVASRVATRAKVTVRACDRSIRSLRQKPGRGSACLTCLHGCAKPSRESLQRGGTPCAFIRCSPLRCSPSPPAPARPSRRSRPPGPPRSLAAVPPPTFRATRCAATRSTSADPIPGRGSRGSRRTTCRRRRPTRSRSSTRASPVSLA